MAILKIQLADGTYKHIQVGLKGDIGEKGERGQKGDDGLAGKDGKDGNAEKVSTPTDIFVAEEGQTVFILSQPYDMSRDRLQVFIGGSLQRYGLDYTETTSTSFTMLNPLEAGLVVIVHYFSKAAALSEDVALALENQATQIAKQVLAIEDGAISPEQFTGTAIEKIQKALDYAIQNDLSVKFAKIYDITGQGSIYINKANAQTETDRRVLYLQGVGGGIKKTDAGTIFTTDGTYSTGDINVSSLKYFGVEGAGTVVWDCDYILRIMSSNCMYHNIDTVVIAPNNYIQSVRFISEHITGGMGWAFEFFGSWDSTFDLFIESRQHGIRNSSPLADLQNKGLRINNTIMENLSGIPIQLGSCFATTISNCYFEHNSFADNLHPQIDLRTLGNDYYQFGLKIENCLFGMTPEQIETNIPAIKWGRISNGGESSGGGAVSNTNTSTGILHDLPDNVTGFVNGTGDYASYFLSTGKVAHYINMTQPRTKDHGIEGITTNVGYMTKFANSVTVELTSGMNVIEIPFSENIMMEDLHSVSTTNGYLIDIKNTQIKAVGDKKITIWVENIDPVETITRSFYGVVYKFSATL